MFIQKNCNCEGTEQLSKSTRSVKSCLGLGAPFLMPSLVGFLPNFAKKLKMHSKKGMLSKRVVMALRSTVTRRVNSSVFAL